MGVCMDQETDHFSDLCGSLAAEQRASCRAMYLWQKARQGRPMPAVGDVGFMHAPDLRQHLFLVAVGNGGGRFLIHRSCGLLDGLHGLDAQGLKLGEALGSPLGELALDCCNSALVARRPFLSADALKLAEDVEIRYRIAFMPLSEGGEKVDHLLGVISFLVARD
jgi:hypothetical protein